MDAVNIESLLKLVKGIATTTPQGAIIKGSVVVAILIAFFIFKRWLKKQEIKRADNNTKKRREDNQGQVTQEAQTISQDAINSEDLIDDLLDD